MPDSHVTFIAEPRPRYYVPTCSCGWVGRTKFTRDAAVTLAHWHRCYTKVKAL